jgi:SRSO17 transposase
MEGELGDYAGPVNFIKVDGTKLESFWDKLVQEHHYLGYKNVIGSRLKYLITLEDRIIGAISFCSAAYKLGLRDKFVGWDEETRLSLLPHLVNNNLFLILPWIKVRHLASHVLALSLKKLKIDWEKWYGVEPYMVETFIEPERYLGTCYAAANWIRLGESKGLGRQGNSFVFDGHIKDLYVIVMSHRFANTFHPHIGRLCYENREELQAIINTPPIQYPKLLKDFGVNQISPESLAQSLFLHLEIFIPFLGRKELITHFVAMIKGLLSDLPHKSLEPISKAFEEPDEFRNFANFMTRSVWDDRGMQEEYQKQLSQFISHPMGMITGDGCDFKKQGSMSAGVAIQPCGPLGKMQSCQASLMVGYASELGYGLADFELYIPEIWFTEEFAEKHDACRIPEELVYKTKNQMMSNMLYKLVESGLFNGKYVGVDFNFGQDPQFLDSLPSGLVYFADVPGTLSAFPSSSKQKVSKSSSQELSPAPVQPVSVEEIVDSNKTTWSEVHLGNGPKGPVMAKDKCIKVVELRDQQPGKEVWLYVMQSKDGSRQYALCNESKTAKLQTIRIPALMRWSMKQCFQECRDYIGLDQYELRTWHGWKRHMLLTSISHFFVNKLRRQYSSTVGSQESVASAKCSKPKGDDCAKSSLITAENQDGDQPDAGFQDAGLLEAGLPVTGLPDAN